MDFNEVMWACKHRLCIPEIKRNNQDLFMERGDVIFLKHF